jgi:uncharacterized protein involved in exopolysaccharide biosynthesis
LLRNILTDAPNEIGTLNQKQSASTVSYYQHQLSAAQHRLDNATGALGHYARQHHIAPAQMANRSLIDPTFAALYQAVQSEQVAVHNASQQLSQTTTPNVLGSSIQVYDPPAVQPALTSKKTLLLDIAIGLIVGLLLSTIFIVWMTATDHTLRYPQEVSELVGLPVLVSTPQVAALAGASRETRSSQS